MKGTHLLIILILLGLSSCMDNSNPDTEMKVEENVNATKEVEIKADKSSNLGIVNNTFLGIYPGQPIADIASDKIKKASPNNKVEKAFETYHILSEGGKKVGYFYPEPLDESLVGNLFITDKDVSVNGIGIGSTYEEIKNTLNTYEVHGSEIESRTSVYFKDYAFELDYPSNHYDLDRDKIPPTAQVVELQIQRSAELIDKLQKK